MGEKQTIASLTKRIEELERFINELKAERKAAADRRIDSELRFLGLRR